MLCCTFLCAFVTFHFHHWISKFSILKTILCDHASTVSTSSAGASLENLVHTREIIRGFSLSLSVCFFSLLLVVPFRHCFLPPISCVITFLRLNVLSISTVHEQFEHTIFIRFSIGTIKRAMEIEGSLNLVSILIYGHTFFVMLTTFVAFIPHLHYLII